MPEDKIKLDDLCLKCQLCPEDCRSLMSNKRMLEIFPHHNSDRHNKDMFPYYCFDFRERLRSMHLHMGRVLRGQSCRKYINCICNIKQQCTLTS